MGAFGQLAFDLCNIGLAPIPTGGPDGKRPLMTGYANPKARVTLGNVVKLQNRFGKYNVALLCGASGIAVVDIDDRSLRWSMTKRFGETPLVVETGSGRVHLYYRDTKGARPVDLRASENIPVEVKARRNIVIAPPSVNPKTGGAYSFLEGDLSEDVLRSLPLFRPDAIHAGLPASARKGAEEGERNRWLFRQCLRGAPHADSFDDLVDVARTRNDECEPPLDDKEVLRVAASAWKIQVEGRNAVGTAGYAPGAPLAEVMDFATRQPGSVMPFVNFLRIKHTARAEPFALSTRAMERDNVLPGWSRQAYRTAIERALEWGYLQIARRGVNRVPSLYVLAYPHAMAPKSTATPSGAGVELYWGCPVTHELWQPGSAEDAQPPVSGFIHEAGRD